MANMLERISITKEHIDNADCESPTKNEVSLALLDHFEGRGDPTVEVDSIFLFRNEYMMDSHLVDWVYWYENDQSKPNPIVMVLDPKNSIAYIDGLDPSF